MVAISRKENTICENKNLIFDSTYSFLKKLFFNFMQMGAMSPCVPVLRVSAVCTEAKENIRTPRTRVTDVVSHSVDAGN